MRLPRRWGVSTLRRWEAAGRIVPDHTSGGHRRYDLAKFRPDCFTPLRCPIGVTLTSAQTQAVAMVIHELATNAAKHGALSGTDGKVLVNWDCTGADRAAILTITWRELGGSPITAPVQFGYGLGLIRDLVPHELGGAVNLTFPPDGACCKIEIPSGKT